ncbi:AMP-binding protein, partial [Vibrio sp.]|uniref:non-ribosomal peptide synthetase n=1 Tax=Vibrio sp. TaxID=678 RepID=UPI00311E289D
MTKDCRHNTLGHFPLHPSQEGIYFEQLIKPESPAYNIGGYIKIDGRLDVELFKKALYLVIDGLDAFGLSFDCNDSISEQSVKPKEMRTKDLDIADLSGEKDPVKQALDQLHQIFSEPFSLQSDCLYINKLLKVQNEEFWWVLKAHHIIVDGYGYAHFSRQVAKAYSCLLYGEPLDWLDDLPSYQEATLNALRYMESAQYHKDKAFWLKRYESLPDPLLDTNSSKQGLSGVQHCEMTLPRDLTQSIRKSCSDLNVSIQQLSLAALSIYYFKSAGAKRLCFGIPLLSRHNRQERQTVGMMTDIIPSLVEISDENQEVSGFIRSISAQQKQEYRHRRFPLTHLKRALNRATGTSGIFNVLVNYEPFDVDLEMGSLKSNFHHCSAPEDSVPLQFRWGDYSDMGQLTLKVTYKPECFTQDEIDLQIERHFSILKYLSQNPSSAISTVPTLSPGEQGLLQNWNNTQQDFPDELCIHQLVEARAAEHPEATALVFNNESLGYGELNQRANQLAHYLLEQGVRPDTLVGLCADRSFEMMIGLLGILKAGGAYVPLDPSYPSERLGHMIQDSDVGVIITQQHLIHDLPNGSAQASYRAIALDCSEVQQQLSHYTEENIDPTLIGLTSRHLAYVIYTSGSTGKPKGVMLQHDGLVSLAYHQGASFGISNISRVLQFASLSFDAAVWEWVLTLSVGARFYLYSREAILNPERLSIEVADAGITHAMLTPAFLPHLDSSLWESVQTLIVGGDKCA